MLSTPKVDPVMLRFCGFNMGVGNIPNNAVLMFFIRQVRLKNITLRMMLKKVEGNLRAKEQLAEG